MSAADRLEALLKGIRDIFDEQRKEVEREILDRVLRAAKGEDVSGAGPTNAARERAILGEGTRAGDSHRDRKRAPKGTAERLCDRALAAVHPAGLEPSDIKAAAEDGYERMLSQSSVRGHLRRGEKHRRYREEGGVWYLGDAHEAMRELQNSHETGEAEPKSDSFEGY